MGKESLHISPIHLPLSPLWSHGETRSGPLTFLGRTDGRTDGRTTRTTGISVLGIGTGDGDRRRPSMAQHNGTTPPSLARLPEEGGDGRGDDDVHCPAPERAVQWRDLRLRLHRAPHYPPINSQTRSLLLVSLTAPLLAPFVEGRREGDGRGVQNKSCLKSGKSLAGISDPAASVLPSLRLSVDPFQTVAHTHHDDPSSGRRTG